MKLEHIRKYIGYPVIVQLSDAVALGVLSRPVKAAPVCNEKGQMLLAKDGSVAPPDAKEDEVAHRPVWPIATRREGADAGAVFRFAIDEAMVSVPEVESGGVLVPGDLVHIHYKDDEETPQVLFELVVEPESVVAITRIVQGPMPEKKPSIIQPGRH